MERFRIHWRELYSICQRVGAQVLRQARLVLADAAVDHAHRLVNRAAHVAVRILLLRAEQRSVRGADGQLDHATVLLFNGEDHKCIGLLREVAVQLADLLLGVFLDGIVQRDLFAGKCELHIGCSFPCLPGTKGSGSRFPSSL